MGRKKLPMKLITKKRARLVCFEKRKKGLKKAAYELSTLCGVDVGMIIYDRDSNESEICGTSLARMLQLYEWSSAQDRRCRSYNVADYVKEESEKAKKKRDKEGRDECGRLSPHQLRELGEFLDAKIAAVRGKIISLKKGEADRRVFLNHQESGIFLNQDQQKPMFWGNSSLLNAEADDHVFLNQESGLFLNPSIQESGVCLNPFLNQESGVCLKPFLNQESGVCSNPFLNQESRVCMNQDQQQTMFWDNSSLMRPNLLLMADDVCRDMPETNHELDIIQDYDGSEAMFWGNTRLMQETFFLPADTEQQQIDLCNNMQDLVNPTMMNQSVEGTQNFMPGVIQQQWQAYYQNNVGF